MVILDTNIIIDHLRQKTKEESALELISKKFSKKILAVSMITIQELYEGQSTKNELKEAFMLSLISPLKILPYTYEIAKLAGQLARDSKAAIELADAAIAATCIINNAGLYSLNKKHFKNIINLELI